MSGQAGLNLLKVAAAVSDIMFTAGCASLLVASLEAVAGDKDAQSQMRAAIESGEADGLAELAAAVADIERRLRAVEALEAGAMRASIADHLSIDSIDLPVFEAVLLVALEIERRPSSQGCLGGIEVSDIQEVLNDLVSPEALIVSLEVLVEGNHLTAMSRRMGEIGALGIDYGSAHVFCLLSWPGYAELCGAVEARILEMVARPFGEFYTWDFAQESPGRSHFLVECALLAERGQMYEYHALSRPSPAGFALHSSSVLARWRRHHGAT